jgi:hypothetical protein
LPAALDIAAQRVSRYRSHAVVRLVSGLALGVAIPLAAKSMTSTLFAQGCCHVFDVRQAGARAVQGSPRNRANSRVLTEFRRSAVARKTTSVSKVTSALAMIDSRCDHAVASVECAMGRSVPSPDADAHQRGIARRAECLRWCMVAFNFGG